MRKFAIRTKKLIVCAAALLGALAGGVGPASSAEPLKIRLQYSSLPGQFGPLVTGAPKYKKDLYKFYGKSYVVEPIFMAGSGPALIALATKEIDIAGLSPQTLGAAVLEAKLDVRVFAQQLTTDMPGWAGTSFWVRKAEIERVPDLKGKVIATNSLNTSVDATVRMHLETFGLKEGKDYQFVEVRFPAQLAALESKRVDMTILLAPWSFRAERNPTLKPLFTSVEVVGPSDNAAWASRTEWIKENRAALVDFLEDNMRLRRWMYDSTTRSDALKLVAEVTKQPIENFESYVFTREDNYRDPHATIVVERFQNSLDILHKAGLLPARIDASIYIDTSLTEDAKARFESTKD